MKCNMRPSRCVPSVHGGRVRQTRPSGLRSINWASKGKTIIEKEGNSRQRVLGKGSEEWCTPGIFREQIKRADVTEAGGSVS